MRLKAAIIYAIAAALVLASWMANYAYYRNSQLPEAGFLRHYIESSYVPYVAFDLLYVANNQDQRTVVNVQVDELPALKFYPAVIHHKLRYQTIYLLRGDYEESLVESRPAMEPLKLNTVRVYYNDGTVSEEDIGEMIIYRGAWPLADEDRPFQMAGGGGVSDHGGWATIRTKGPVLLTGVSSAWLEKLGSFFQYELKVITERGGALSEAITYPLELDSDESLKLDYKFMIPGRTQQAMEVYNLQLHEDYENSAGHKYDYTVFAQYLPSPSETEMRAYVREKRRGAQ